MKNNLTYLQTGEYQIPHLTIPSSPELKKYGRMRKKFLQEHKPNLYTSLLMSGQLMDYLHQTEALTQQQVNGTLLHLLTQNPAPMKEKGSLAWTQHMEMLKHQAEELVLPETIYT